MGKGFDPGVGWNHGGLGELNPMPTNIGQAGLNQMVLPTYSDCYRCNFGGNIPMPFPGIETFSSYPIPSAPVPHLDRIQLGPVRAATSQKIFLVFDHTGDQTNLIFNPPIPQFRAPEPPIIAVTDGSSARTSHELHEDTEDIDALLYSDSYGDDTYDEGEEEASTGHSPLDMVECTEVEVAAAFTLSPKKRLRVDKEPDASLTDTASSALIHFPVLQPLHKSLNSDESGFLYSNEDVGPLRPLEEGEISAVDAAFPRSKRARRDRIRETVNVLRRIIPGGKGKDAVSVLDDAIRYLKFVKIKAEAEAMDL